LWITKDTSDKSMLTFGRSEYHGVSDAELMEVSSSTSKLIVEGDQTDSRVKREKESLHVEEVESS
jgi:hypothetical protein